MLKTLMQKHEHLNAKEWSLESFCETMANETALSEPGLGFMPVCPHTSASHSCRCPPSPPPLPLPPIPALVPLGRKLCTGTPVTATGLLCVPSSAFPCVLSLVSRAHLCCAPCPLLSLPLPSPACFGLSLVRTCAVALPSSVL